MLKNARERRLVGLTLLAVVVLGGSYAYRAVADRFEALATEVEAMEKELGRARRLEEQRQGKEAKFRQVTDEVNLTGDRLLAVREQITTLIRNSGIEHKVLRASGSSSAKDEEFEAINYTLTDVTATPENLMRFLFLLDAQSSVMEIKKMSMTLERPNEYHSALKGTIEVTRLAKSEPSKEKGRKGTRR